MASYSKMPILLDIQLPSFCTNLSGSISLICCNTLSLPWYDVSANAMISTLLMLNVNRALVERSEVLYN